MKLSGFQILILVIGIILILLGLYVQITSYKRVIDNGHDIHVDSLLEITKVDTIYFKDSLAKDLHRGLIRTETKATQSFTENHNEKWDEIAYKYLLFGTGLIVFLFILPFLEEFSFLNLFSAKFKERIDAKKAESNSAEESLARPDPAKFREIKFEEKKIEPIGFEKTLVDASLVKYQNDPQKTKWGGKDEVNGRKLSARVTPDLSDPELFEITLRVISTDKRRPLRGKVKFHLHPTFLNDHPVIFVRDGEANLKLKAYGAFTVGAESEGGSTRLELDLAELSDAPKIFRSR